MTKYGQDRTNVTGNGCFFRIMPCRCYTPSSHAVRCISGIIVCIGWLWCHGITSTGTNWRLWIYVDHIAVFKCNFYFEGGTIKNKMLVFLLHYRIGTNDLLVTKFGWRYLPDETSSYARRSFTLRDSKSIRLSSRETKIHIANEHIFHNNKPTGWILNCLLLN